MSVAGLSVIVPAYNEAEHLAANMERLIACLDGCGRRFEILIVGSESDLDHS